ncbi:MAG: hypothetical protein J6Y89_06825 [Lachnospiraceae bacterium]|nr:hypothetical protein [Lachnospiraceae bacterium]
MKEQKGSEFKLNVGLPSIILLLCVLGLSLFAILTIRAAYTGLKTAKTSRNAVQEYYKAEVKADRIQLKIAGAFDECVRNNLQQDGIDENIRSVDGVESVEAGTVIYNVRVNDYSSIRVEMRVTREGDDFDMHMSSHRLVVDDMDGYSGNGFEIEEIELF